jgi:prepilin-type N-terminal cleavage/methylation domain-containing protein
MNREIGRRAVREAADRGFTLVEFAVVLAILVVLVSFSVPRFRAAVERTRAAQATQFLSDVRVAQERYQAAVGSYAREIGVLELTAPFPVHFDVGMFAVAGSPGAPQSWSLTLTRKAESTTYGPYTVTYTERGYDAQRSTLSALPEISPVEESELFRP